jgi:alkylation response protein AidB-like acyl-CoA dehydrogenase
MVRMMKKLALMVAGVAAQKYGQKLQHEQEVLARIADMVIEIFAMESGLLRTQKIIQARGEEKARYHMAAVKAYVDQTVPRIERWGKEVVARCEEGDTLRTQLALVKKLARMNPVDLIGLKREVADRIIDLESYPF